MAEKHDDDDDLAYDEDDEEEEEDDDEEFLVDDNMARVIEQYRDEILRMGDPLKLEQFVYEEGGRRDILVSSIGQILAIYHVVRAPLFALSECEWVPEDRRKLLVDVVRSLENCFQYRDAKN